MQPFSSINSYNLQREHNRSNALFKGLKENVKEQKRRVGVCQAEKRKGIPDKKLYLGRLCMGDPDSAAE